MSTKNLPWAEALAAIRSAVAALPEQPDGGTSNFDDLIIFPVGHRAKTLAAEIRAAGGDAWETSWMRKPCVYLTVGQQAYQGVNRTRIVCTAKDVLATFGIQASIYYQTD